MAMLIHRNHPLTVVAVRMSEIDGVPVVDLRLVVSTPDRQRTIAKLHVPLTRFGFAETWGRTAPDLQVPTDVCQWIAEMCPGGCNSPSTVGITAADWTCHQTALNVMSTHSYRTGGESTAAVTEPLSGA